MAAIEEHFNLKIGELIADRGYGSAENLEKLEELDVKTNIPLWSFRSGETFFKELADGFRVNDETKEVHCPAGHMMKNSCRDHLTKREIYTLPRPVCMACPQAQTCMTAYEYKTRSKRFIVPDNYKIFFKVTEQQKDPAFKKKLWERMWKMEGIFAEAKSFHGLRRARYRGRSKVQMQVYMTSTVQNLKRLAGAALESLYAFLFSAVFKTQKVINFAVVPLNQF